MGDDARDQLQKDLNSYQAIAKKLCNLTEDDDKALLTKTMVKLVHYLRSIDQEDTTRRDALAVAIHCIGKSCFMESEDLVVRASTAGAMVHAFRIYVPNFPPFCLTDMATTDEERVLDSLNFLVDLIPHVTDEESGKKIGYALEYINTIQLFNCVFKLEGEDIGENEFIDKAIKYIIECKIKDAGKRKVLSNILRELILVSEHEDFNVIDNMLSYLISGVANYNKNAAQIVRDAFVDTGEHFAVVLSLFFNTMFVQFDKIPIKIANKWHEVLIALFKIDTNLISEDTLSYLHDLVHSTTTKITERSKAITCLCELYLSPEAAKMVELKDVIAKTLGRPVEDAKVRELIVKKCSDILLKNGLDENILKIFLNFYNDTKDGVREKVAERLQAIICSSIDFVTEETVNILGMLTRDRVSIKVRLAAIRSIATIFKTHRAHSDLPLLKQLLRSLLEVYWAFARSKQAKDLTELEESGRIEIMMAFQTLIVGGESVEPEERAVNLSRMWLDEDGHFEKFIRSMFIDLYAMRKPFERTLELIADETVEEGRIEESFRSTIDYTCVKAKDSMNESIMKVMLQNENLLDIGRKITYLEMPVKSRIKNQKKFIDAIRTADSSINLTAISELCQRSTDCVMETTVIIKLFKLLSETTDERKKLRTMNLINYFSNTHEYSFANLDVFEIVISFLEKKESTKEMLILLKNIGGLLSEVYQGRKDAEGVEDEDLDLSILKTLSSYLEEIIEGDDNKLSKLAIAAMISVGNGGDITIKLTQKILQKLTGNAIRKIKSCLNAGEYDDEFNNANLVLGCVMADTSSASRGQFLHIFEDYIIGNKLSMPETNAAAFIKCCERYMRFILEERTANCERLVHFISSQLRENRAEAKAAASSALFRLSSFKAVRTCLTGDDIRQICFQLASKKEKALKHIENKDVPLMWVSILIILEFDNDKVWVAKIQQIARIYREQSSDELANEAESVLCYVIDILQMSFTLEELKNPEGQKKLEEIQDRLRVFISAFTSPPAYGLRKTENDRKKLWAKLSRSFGILHGIAQVCRQHLLTVGCTGGLKVTQKTYCVCEIVMQEILRQSAESKMSIDPISSTAILKLFSNKLFQLAKLRGKLIPPDESVHMPEYLTYATQGSSAGKRKQPKDIAKIKLDDHQSDEDNDDHVEEKIIPKETKTRSGRAIRRRIIDGTEEDEKKKSELASQNTSNVSTDSDISTRSQASSRNSSRSRSRSPIKKATPNVKKTVKEKQKDEGKDDSVDTSQEIMSIDSADDDALMSPPRRRARRSTAKPELVIKAKSKRKTMGRASRAKSASNSEMETESEAEMTPQRNAQKAASKKEEKENIGRSSTRIKTMNLDSSEASEKEDTPKRGRRTRLEEKKMDDSNVTVNRRKRKPASSQSSQESETGCVSSRRSSSRISSQKTESPKKVKAPSKKQKTVAKSGTRRSIRK